MSAAPMEVDDAGDGGEELGPQGGGALQYHTVTPEQARGYKKWLDTGGRGGVYRCNTCHTCNNRSLKKMCLTRRSSEARARG